MSAPAPTVAQALAALQESWSAQFGAPLAVVHSPAELRSELALQDALSAMRKTCLDRRATFESARDQYLGFKASGVVFPPDMAQEMDALYGAA